MTKVFIVLPQDGNKFGIYTDCNGHNHPVKSGLTEDKAEMMAEILNNIVGEGSDYDEDDDNSWCNEVGC
ncbi:hypothetical protein C4577_06600 [Candidatus Parcubacteria bacterium]|nr:MAG: hypothetical protein C4577_06600 [Candidatus Parcubacteria bacterium]